MSLGIPVHLKDYHNNLRTDPNFMLLLEALENSVTVTPRQWMVGKPVSEQEHAHDSGFSQGQNSIFTILRGNL